MGFEQNWCLVHWYLFAAPIIIAVLVYLVFCFRLFLLSRRLYRLEMHISDLDDNDTEWMMKHPRSEQKLFSEMDRLEEKVSTMDEATESMTNGWIPGIVLFCLFAFAFCVLCTEGTVWLNG